MRILLISDLFPPLRGGLEFHVRELASALVRRGDEVQVATLTRNPDPPDGVVVRTLTSSAWLLPHETPQRALHPPVPDPAARIALTRLLREFRPDVIHGHSWLTVSLPHTDVPVVYTAHDYGLICQLRTLLRPDRSICGGPPDKATCIKCGTPTYGRLKSVAVTHGTVAGRQRLPAQLVLAVSDAVRASLLPWLDVPIETMPNFVAPARPSALPPLSDIADGFVMYAGDAGDHKGVPDLLEVWQDRPPSLPLLLATPSRLASLVPNGVTAVSLSREQVAAGWRKAALAVVPSRWADPCPTVVLEAMAAGLPIVATNVGGIPSLVRDGVDGILVPPRQPERLRAAIESLIADPARRAEMGARGAERAQEFHVDVVSERIRAVYERLIETARVPA
jgi:glycogen(starch) synthase